MCMREEPPAVVGLFLCVLLHQASSPDEEALVKAAASHGVTLLSREGAVYVTVAL